MSRKSSAKRQHYVLRLLLKRFTDKNTVWVFDKWENKTFKSSITGVAAENYYYDYEIDGVVGSFEDMLTNYESKASRIINRIVENQSIHRLTNEDRYVLSEFIAIQYLRTPFAFDQMLNFHDRLMEELFFRGIKPENIEGYEEPDENLYKLLRLSQLSDFKVFAQSFYNKTWLLQSTSNNLKFWISDNPISFQNLNKKEERGGIGLEVDGIEVYLPLSKELTLALWCSSTTKFITKSYKSIENDKDLARQLPEQHSSIKLMYDCINNGKLLELTDANVTNLNSLQVKYSTRFIFSYDNDFTLAKEMIKDVPQYRKQR